MNIDILQRIFAALVGMEGSLSEENDKPLGSGKSEVRHLSKAERKARRRRHRLSTCQRRRRRYQ